LAGARRRQRLRLVAGVGRAARHELRMRRVGRDDRPTRLRRDRRQALVK
jgi:hypothetical protein